MKIGVGADHGGFEMKQELAERLMRGGHTIVDFGNKVYDTNDDYRILPFPWRVPWPAER